MAQPALAAWAPAKEALQLFEKTPNKEDKAPKALACYGLYLPEAELQTEGMLLRFVTGRPVSAVTCAFLGWLVERVTALDKRVLILFWDNARWHVSREVKQWLKEQKRTAKRTGGVRLVVCPLPKKSPWLNPIEPKWAHGKRAVVEPERVLSAQELAQRLCAYYGCDHLEHLKQ